MFKRFVVPHPKSRQQIIKDMHNDISHFGEAKTLVEIQNTYFWHNQTKEVKYVVRSCKPY
jgi:hypothetical protein